MTLNAATIQFPVTMDVARNLACLIRSLDRLEPGTLAVAPEGALSGYLPRPDFIKDLDDETTRAAIESARAAVAQRGLHLVAGACLRDDGQWRNRALYMGPDRRLETYDKINLAMSERGVFQPGDQLPVFDILVGGQPLRLGVQMCREIRYPAQWRRLAAKGAQVFAYVNNAIGSPHGDQVWRAHMISRAAETQRFVLGANNAAPDQTCPSMIVAPSGLILAETPGGSETVAQARLDLTQVSDWVLSQAREDVVTVRDAAKILGFYRVTLDPLAPQLRQHDPKGRA